METIGELKLSKDSGLYSHELSRAQGAGLEISVLGSGFRVYSGQKMNIILLIPLISEILLDLSMLR